MTKWLAVLVWLVPAICAAEEWTAVDRSLYGASVVLGVVDWAQTRTIAANPDRYHENNSVLGEHPSKGRVDAYFAVSAVVVYLVTDYLPSDLRKVFLSGAVALEVKCVSHNYQLGISARF